MTERASGTSGGWRGMNGAQRRLALALGGGFLFVLLAVGIANATSMVADFAAAGTPVTPFHVWLFEGTSIAAWLSELPVIWWLVWRIKRWWPRWWWIVAALAGFTVAGSAWHIALMVALRKGVYLGQGQHYTFTMGVDNPWLYEYRKDVATILQFAGLALIAQWLIARAGEAPADAAAPPLAAAGPVRTLAVGDGAVTHHVPIDEIERVTAAGNYVELGWRERTLLHRATLTAVEAELGAAFVRIHRSQLVRRAAIRQVTTDRSGDFTVALDSGAELRGSRRYRTGMDPQLGV